MPVAAWVDESWSMDFISDEFSDERRIRLLTMVETCILGAKGKLCQQSVAERSVTVRF